MGTQKKRQRANGTNTSSNLKIDSYTRQRDKHVHKQIFFYLWITEYEGKNWNTQFARADALQSAMRMLLLMLRVLFFLLQPPGAALALILRGRRAAMSVILFFIPHMSMTSINSSRSLAVDNVIQPAWTDPLYLTSGNGSRLPALREY